MDQQLTVMIVEDQPLTVEYLRTLIDWKSLGFSVVAEAGNGKEALKFLERFRPDIILADVEMPVMDGLAFSEAALRIYPWCRIVFISSHRQFDYVKRALNLGVADYILKHELNSSVLRDLLAARRKDIETYRSRYSIEWQNRFRFEEEHSPFRENLSFFLRKGDLWIHSIRADSPAEGKEKPLLPIRLGSCRSVLSFSLYSGGSLCFYWAEDLEGCGGPWDEEALAEELRIHHRQQGGGGQFLYLLGLFSGSRYEMQTLFRRMRDLRNRRGLFPGYYILSENMVDNFPLEPADSLPEKGSGSLVESAKEYMREHFMQPVGTSDVAEGIGVSTAYLCQKFKEETDQTILKVLTGMRIDRAKELLQGGYSPIHDVALACGFLSSRYFSQVFRKMTGETPSAFRENKRVEHRKGRGG